MIQEIWKPITGYESLYTISNLGNVKSLKRNCNTKGGKQRIVEERLLRLFDIKGYTYVNLNNNGIKQFRVHKLVALAFVDNPNSYPLINHIDGCKTNNITTNLEWCTAKQNAEHASKNGLLKGRKGEAHHNCKLTQTDIEDIRLKLKTTNGRTIAKQYGISESMVSLIKHNKNWIQ